MIITLMLFTTIAWIATWLLIYLRFSKDTSYVPSKGLVNITWLISLLLHSLLLIVPWLQKQVISLSFISTLSLALCLSITLLFVTQLKRPLSILGLFIIPLTLPVIIASIFLPHNIGSSITLNNDLSVHIISALLAYSMLTLAALQALVLSTQNRHLHNHQPSGFIRALPPLQDMEALLFKLIQTGVILLTIGIVSGLIYMDSLFGHQIAHKTILSIIAWLSFSTLLYGHWRYGWRGRTATRWTLTGFSFLMLAFFGSKFILEYLVKTT